MLTDDIINKLPSYHGKSILGNVNIDIKAIQKSVWDTYFHLVTKENDAYAKHVAQKAKTLLLVFCSKAKRPEPHKIKSLYVSKITKGKLELIKPVYQDLASLELLKKRLNGEGENVKNNLQREGGKMF